MRKFLKNTWVVNIGGFILGALALRGIDKLFINDFIWDWIKGVFSSIAGFFSTEYSVKLYFLILLPILVIAAIIGIGLLFSAKKKIKEIRYPDWAEYTKDVFDNIQYRWQYDFRGMDSKIKNVTPYCNKCSCILVGNCCPNCNESYNDYTYGSPTIKNDSDIEALVIHRIENGLYKNSTYFKA